MTTKGESNLLYIRNADQSCPAQAAELRALIEQRSASVEVGSHEHTLSSPAVTAPLPDVRVEVGIAVTPGQVALVVIVQNHSPVVVYMGNVSLALKNGQRLLFPRDAVTGEYQMERRLEPGQKFDFIMSPLEILRQVRKEDVLCAVARDSIGREYRSSEESAKAALHNLSRDENQGG